MSLDIESTYNSFVVTMPNMLSMSDRFWVGFSLYRVPSDWHLEPYGDYM